MLDKDLHIMAYESIKSNYKMGDRPRDGLSLAARADGVISRLRDHSFQFNPPLIFALSKGRASDKDAVIRSFPCLQDGVVLKVMALILEAIYDAPKTPLFTNDSHGFRKGRNPHSALMQLSQVKSIQWVIEGDIKVGPPGSLNKAYYKKLEELLCRYIDDQQFLDLY